MESYEQHRVLGHVPAITEGTVRLTLMANAEEKISGCRLKTLEIEIKTIYRERWRGEEVGTRRGTRKVATRI
jgi:hypothetical protein